MRETFSTNDASDARLQQLWRLLNNSLQPDRLKAYMATKVGQSPQESLPPPDIQGLNIQDSPKLAGFLRLVVQTE